MKTAGRRRSPRTFSGPSSVLTRSPGALATERFRLPPVTAMKTPADERFGIRIGFESATRATPSASDEARMGKNAGGGGRVSSYAEPCVQRAGVVIVAGAPCSRAFGDLLGPIGRLLPATRVREREHRLAAVDHAVLAVKGRTLRNDEKETSVSSQNTP